MPPKKRSGDDEANNQMKRRRKKNGDDVEFGLAESIESDDENLDIVRNAFYALMLFIICRQNTCNNHFHHFYTFTCDVCVK